MKPTNVILFAIALLLPMLCTQCVNRGSRSGGWGGGAGAGGVYDPAQGDFYGLPQRNEGISLYGPGSEKVQRDPVSPVYFAFDSAAIQASEVPKIQTLSNIARQTLIIIAGHTDPSGTFEYNRGLGERRALAVRQELLKMGVSSGNIQTISYGEDLPSGQGANVDRRAEFGALIQGGPTG